MVIGFIIFFIAMRIMIYTSCLVKNLYKCVDLMLVIATTKNINFLIDEPMLFYKVSAQPGKLDK